MVPARRIDGQLATCCQERFSLFVSRAEQYNIGGIRGAIDEDYLIGGKMGYFWFDDHTFQRIAIVSHGYNSLVPSIYNCVQV